MAKVIESAGAKVKKSVAPRPATKSSLIFVGRKAALGHEAAENHDADNRTGTHALGLQVGDYVLVRAG